MSEPQSALLLRKQLAGIMWNWIMCSECALVCVKVSWKPRLSFLATKPSDLATDLVELSISLCFLRTSLNFLVHPLKLPAILLQQFWPILLSLPRSGRENQYGATLGVRVSPMNNVNLAFLVFAFRTRVELLFLHKLVRCRRQSHPGYRK